MARLSITQKTQLNNMNSSAQRGTLGTRIDALEYGGAITPATGTNTSKSVVKFDTAPAIGTATATHAAVTLSAATQTITTGFTQPDYARAFTVKGNASGITGNVVITGTNIAGETITDTIALSGASEVAGVKAFASIVSVLFPVETHAGTDTVSIGRSNVIGLPAKLTYAGEVIVKLFDGSADNSTITVSSTAYESNTATPAGTLNSVKRYTLYFLA